jgi:L-lactate dehydrogenase complex protein LldF
VSFADRSRVALANRALRASLVRHRQSRTTERSHFLSGFNGDFEEYRHRARSIRERTLAELDLYAERFAAQVTARGGQMHYAGDADEACRIAVGIARQHDGHLAIKMKSMLTEEIHLRPALAKAGVRPVETDLGEWIVQLANEAPSHIIMPAVHKQRAEVKQLFDQVLGPSPADDAEALVARARTALRAEFLNADVGITGCNFAAADTGTIVLVSNEGNGRLTTSGPPLHIALVPIEKLVPTLDDAVTLLKVLCGSATGQKLTAYVSLIAGPRRAGELDGPSELHVVLVDNGRSRVIGTELEEALCCIRCGACLDVCPVYGRVGGHTYDSVYPGPIGISLTPITAGASRASDELAHASSLCGACADVCPVRIDLPRLILETRRRAVSARRTGWRERVTFLIAAAVMRHKWLYRTALWFGRLASRLVARDGRIERLAGMGAWMDRRDLPAFARESFSARFARRRREAASGR